MTLRDCLAFCQAACAHSHVVDARGQGEIPRSLATRDSRGLNYYRASPLRPATANDPGVSSVQIAPEFLRIDVPTLVLWAQDDVALLPCLTDGLDAHIPDLKLQPIHAATHWVVHEQPERIKSEMADFLQQAR